MVVFPESSEGDVSLITAGPRCTDTGEAYEYETSS